MKIFAVIHKLFLKIIEKILPASRNFEVQQTRHLFPSAITHLCYY